jgi:ribonucleoside-diphosphate reductase alpha chain
VEPADIRFDAMGKGADEGSLDADGGDAAAPCPPGGLPAAAVASSGYTRQKLSDNVFVIGGAATASAGGNPVAVIQSRAEAAYVSDGGTALAVGFAEETTAILDIDSDGKVKSEAERRVEARMKGYEGDSCGECGNFTLLRNGTCMKCDTCGSTSGCS